jgi:hypothetical protein
MVRAILPEFVTYPQPLHALGGANHSPRPDSARLAPPTSCPSLVRSTGSWLASGATGTSAPRSTEITAPTNPSAAASRKANCCATRTASRWCPPSCAPTGPASASPDPAGPSPWARSAAASAAPSSSASQLRRVPAGRGPRHAWHQIPRASIQRGAGGAFVSRAYPFPDQDVLTVHTDLSLYIMGHEAMSAISGGEEASSMTDAAIFCSISRTQARARERRCRPLTPPLRPRGPP